jgi:hypothetical protein
MAPLALTQNTVVTVPAQYRAANLNDAQLSAPSAV